MRIHLRSGQSVAEFENVLRGLSLTRRRFLETAAAAVLAPFVPSFPARAAQELGLTEVATGIFTHTGVHEEFSPMNAGDISNISFIVGKNAIAVVDTGGSATVGRKFLAALRAVSDKPIRYVINTHMHPDHVFGNAAFVSAGTAFVAHHKMPRALASRQERYLAINKQNLGDEAFEGTTIVMPTLTVADRLELDLGERKLLLETQKTAHTDNDMTVRDGTTNTLFLGDLLFVDRIPSIDGSIKGWIDVIDGLSMSPADRVVPGHGPASVTWPEAAKPLLAYLNVIAEDVRTMIKQGKTMTDAMKSAAQEEKSKWLLADQYHARNISAAFAELEWE
jgi:quinoprotein relay system zinc metallohydrolase 2